MESSKKQTAPKWKLPDGWQIVENPTNDQLKRYGLYESADQEKNPTAIAPKGQGGVNDARLVFAKKPVTLYRFGRKNGSWWSPKCVKMYAELKQSLWKNYAICPGWNELNNYGKMQYQGYAVIGETAAIAGDKLNQTLSNSATSDNKYYDSFALQVFLYLDEDNVTVKKFPENIQKSYEPIKLPEKFINQQIK